MNGQPRTTGTVALVESPVQLLNVLEWVHERRTAVSPPAGGAGGDTAAVPAGLLPSEATGPAGGGDGGDGGPPACTLVVLPPRDPMTRGQLRRMAELARDEGLTVCWREPRTSRTAPVRAAWQLAPVLLAARRIVLGDPFSRYVQALLPLTRARDLVVVDDGTATMEFVSQLARGERLVRWHRTGTSARDRLLGVLSGVARRRLTPGDGPGGRRVEVFSAMPVTPPPGVVLTPNRFAWTRARFGPPQVTDATDIVGTSLVETGVVDPERYLAAVASLARVRGAGRYFAHRREREEKLRRISETAGLEIVRPDLPLELVARRGPVGRTIVSFPSTVVHTLPLALEGTGAQVAVCELDPSWLTEGASPRARGFLTGVTGTARDLHGLDSVGTVTP
ncbi:hypothetical protein ACFV1B_25060 [Streptomyces sp. NPDC059637]|uniref:hypothetical protein n=1 Tax=Streptomyces sp. NPDC059637 TaxID=3347752 RepID=UPI0036B06DA0